MGIEPTPPAWKAGALPLSYARMSYIFRNLTCLNSINSKRVAVSYLQAPASKARVPLSSHQELGAVGFEPTKAEPPDLQSGPVGRFGTLPVKIMVADHLVLWWQTTVYHGGGPPSVVLCRCASPYVTVIQNGFNGKS